MPSSCLQRLRTLWAQRDQVAQADLEPRRDGELQRIASCACTRAISLRREDVLRAIVRFVQGRTKAERRHAQKVILTHPVAAAHRAPVRRPGRADPHDAVTLRELAYWHQEYNLRYFGGTLAAHPDQAVSGG